MNLLLLAYITEGIPNIFGVRVSPFFRFNNISSMAAVFGGWPSLILVMSCVGVYTHSVATAAALVVPAVIVFGDSTSDPGNNNYIHTLLKSDFPPYGRDFIDHQPTGRFCNGKLPTDFIAEGLGVKKTIPPYLDPHLTPQDLMTGVSFASAGTGYDNLTASILNVIPLWKEIEYFQQYQLRLKQMLGDQRASDVINKAIYLISIGTNDFIANYLQLPIRSLQFTASEYVNFILHIADSFIKNLYNLGARRISLAGLPPIGCLPLLRNMNLLGHGKCMEKYNGIAVHYNTKLQATIEELGHELPGLVIVYSDTYDVLYDAIHNPAKYGFEVVGRACCGSGTIELGYLCNRFIPACWDASTFVFWDSVHPTQRLYEIAAHNLLTNFIPRLI